MRAAEPAVHSIPIAVVTPANLGEHVRLRARDITAAVLRRLAPSARDSAWVNALPNSRSQTEPTPGAITTDPPATPVAPTAHRPRHASRRAPTPTIALALFDPANSSVYNFSVGRQRSFRRSTLVSGHVPCRPAWWERRARVRVCFNPI